MRLSLVFGLAVGALLHPFGSVVAQRFHPRWEIRGLDISRHGGWRVKGRLVAAERAGLLSRGDFPRLNAPIAAATPAAGSSGPVVSGVFAVPMVLFRYKNTDPSAVRDTSQYNAVLFSATPPFGRPYTLRTYYAELSKSLFTMTGQSIGWARLDSNEVTYTGAPGTCSGNPYGGTNCNGLFSADAQRRMQGGLREALAKVDAGAGGVDFGLFDNDGPDGAPNSGDDDGIVDMMGFAHATQDGACGGNNHIWAHRWVLGGGDDGGSYVTNDPRFGGGLIRVRDYFVQSGLGGSTACNGSQIMPIGTAAHEFGHALGLPDLYDTIGETEGIGGWGLMGAGNYSSPDSPARMEAWSLNELGWITVVPISARGMRTLGAASVGDAALYGRPNRDNPRGEYFLIENRQPSFADTALLRAACQVWFQDNGRTDCPGGLLVWHVDSLRIASGILANTVNTNSIHGVALAEADGAADLWCHGTAVTECNRGDAGDVYPGMTGNRRFSASTAPSSRLNNGPLSGFRLDSMATVTPEGVLRFYVTFGAETVIQASVVVYVDSVPYSPRYEDVLDTGETVNVYVDSVTSTNNGSSRMVWRAWSNGANRTQNYVASGEHDTLTAELGTEHFVRVSKTGPGTVHSTPIFDVTGAFLPAGDTVILRARSDSGKVWDGWSGWVESLDTVLTLRVDAPMNVVALFDDTLRIVTRGTLPSVLLAHHEGYTLEVTGGFPGPSSWAIVDGSPPPGMLIISPGILYGAPRDTGTYTFTARVSARLQTDTATYTIRITEPTYSVEEVLDAIFQGTTIPLYDIRLYLDLRGNANGLFDLGDVLKWLARTGNLAEARRLIGEKP